MTTQPINILDEIDYMKLWDVDTIIWHLVWQWMWFQLYKVSLEELELSKKLAKKHLSTQSNVVEKRCIQLGEYDTRDYDLADIFNTTETKSELYDKIINYLNNKWFIKWKDT